MATRCHMRPVLDSLWVAITLSVLSATPCHAQAMNAVLDWNLITSDTLVAGAQNSVLQTRSFAMVHVAIHDALNAIDQRYGLYGQARRTTIGASADAAVGTAAYDVLATLVPLQRDALAATYASRMNRLTDGSAKTAGITVGKAAAAEILALRTSDRSATANRPYTPGTGAGAYQPTTPTAAMVTPGWGEVTPFAVDLSQFRAPVPYTLNDDQYSRDFAEVKLAGAAENGARTAEQTQIARFWVEAAATMWNRIARTVAHPRRLDLWESARLFALLNVAQADATISVFEAKYFYSFWRPATAIRGAHLDGNPATEVDPAWTPLLTASNHPEYPSGHAIQGAAAATVLGDILGDHAEFSVGSLSLPNTIRSFTSFSQASRENGDSRIYGGIHFRTAIEIGWSIGTAIGRRVEQQMLQPQAFRRPRH